MKYSEAIAQATVDLMDKDPKVIVLGEGVTDEKGIFGTTRAAFEKYPDRVIETPLSENMLTGALAGLAAEGYKPIYVHARAEFSLLGMEHLVNTIAKWPWLHNGQQLPIIIRMLVGRGWGQGPTHSQSFHTMFRQVPGLAVFYPVHPNLVSPYYLSAYREGNPTIIVEPRRLYDFLHLGLGQERLSSQWNLTIYTIGDIVIEAAVASEELLKQGIKTRVAPIGDLTFPSSPTTLPYILCDTWHNPDADVCPPFKPLGTSAALEAAWYPTASDIVQAVCDKLGIEYVEDRGGAVPDRDGRKEPF